MTDELPQLAWSVRAPWSLGTLEGRGSTPDLALHDLRGRVSVAIDEVRGALGSQQESFTELRDLDLQLAKLTVGNIKP